MNAPATAARARLRNLWSRIDVYVWVLLLPLLLIGIGSWERSRNQETQHIYAEAAAGLPAVLAQLRSVAAENPMAMVQADAPGARAMPATMAVAEVEQALPVATRGAMLARVRAPLAMIVMSGGAIVLLAGAGGMLVAAQAGRAARQSREQLIAGFSRVHRALPFILGAMVIGLAASILSIAVFEAISLWFWERVSGNAMKLIVMGVILAGTAVYGAFTALRGLRDIFALATPDPIDEAAHLVTEAEAPGLWRFVRDLASRQQALVPDAIIVGLDGGFYVTEHPVRLHPGERMLDGRTLHIPAPYLEMLDEEELAGVIGHELAHFVGEDTAYSRHFSPIYLGLERALTAIGQGAAKGFGIWPAYRLGEHMFDRFDHAVKHWGRLREFEADRLSSLASGPRAIAHSLLRTSVIAPVVSTALDHAFQHPAARETDLVEDMRVLVREHGWPDVTHHLEDHAAHPTDTHPSTPQRIAALNLPLDEHVLAAASRPLAERDTPGERLFADWLATRRALTADFTAAAERAHAEHHASLESAAAGVSRDALKLFENVVPAMWVMGVAAGLFATGALATFVFGGRTAFAREPVSMAILAGTCLVFAVLFLAFTLVLNRRRSTPMLVLSPDTFVHRKLDRPIPWLDVEGYHVGAASQLTMVFLLNEAAALPGKLGWSSRVQIKRKKRTVTIGCYGVRGYRHAAFAELIQRYLDAAYARRALEERADRPYATPSAPTPEPA